MYSELLWFFKCFYVRKEMPWVTQIGIQVSPISASRVWHFHCPFSALKLTLAPDSCPGCIHFMVYRRFSNVHRARALTSEYRPSCKQSQSSKSSLNSRLEVLQQSPFVCVGGSVHTPALVHATGWSPHSPTALSGDC